MQKSTENVLVSPKYRVAQRTILRFFALRGDTLHRYGEIWRVFSSVHSSMPNFTLINATIRV